MAASQAELETYARAAAQRYGVPEEMFVWQIGKESSWDVTARNPKSTAKGLGQFIDGTEKMFGINAMDPYQALDTAAKYDAMLFKQTGSWEKALTSYGTLHGADDKTMAAFNSALGGNVAETSMKDKLLAAINPTNIYKSLITGGGSIGGAIAGAVTGDDDQGGLLNNTLNKISGNIGLIVLGIVVIALAVLSNNTVQGLAKKAVLKR